MGPRGLVRVRSVPSAGRKTRGDTVREAEVEANFLWPMLRGKNIHALSTDSSGLYAIVCHDPHDLTRVLSVDELSTLAPRLYDYLEPWIDRLAARSPYRGALEPTPEHPWGIQGPWMHLQ